MNTVESVWDYLVDSGIATNDELQLVTGINGYTIETLNDVHYYRTAENLPEDEGDVAECDSCGAELDQDDEEQMNTLQCGCGEER